MFKKLGMPKVGKTVKVTFFANHQVKPQTITWKNEIIEVYPLNASVVYGHASSIIKVEKSGSPILVSTDLEQLKELELKEFTDKYEKYIVSLIENEAKLYGEKFSIVGLGKRLKKYESPILWIVGELTISELQNWFLYEMGQERTKKELMKASDIFFTMATYLYKNEDLKGITVYEWLFGEGKNKLLKFLENKVIRHENNALFVEDIEIKYLTSLLDWVAQK